MLFLIPIGIIIASLIVMLVIIFRHFSDLIVIDVDSIPQEKANKVKERIVQEKLARNLKSYQQIIKGALRPLNKKVKEWLQKFSQKIQTLEKQTKQYTQPLQQVDAKQRAMELLEKASKLLSEEKFEPAESIYIKVLEQDNENVDAYQALVDIYRETRDYKQARETCRYLLKLLQRTKNANEPEGQHRIAGCYADLGEIYQLEDKPELAIKNFARAVKLEPNNPRLLDLMLKISIIMKRKDLASQAFTNLRNADPENQKLAELQEIIKQLPDSNS